MIPSRRRRDSVPRLGSDVGSVMAKFRDMAQRADEDSKEDVFSPDWTPPKFDKDAADYGRPKVGSLTEKRGIAAGLQTTYTYLLYIYVICTNTFYGTNVSAPSPCLHNHIRCFLWYVHVLFGF